MQSWGRIHKPRQNSIPVSWRAHALPSPSHNHDSVLPFGLGHSYGDSCLNEGQTVLTTSSLDRFLSFDTASGIIQCEAGTNFSDILYLTAPKGWFLPVTPGTKFVTVGGALANDVHGKNHHIDGTFGHAIRRFELLRSDGSRRICSPTQNADWFYATIGGLGLTGLITWAEFQLTPIDNQLIEQEVIKFGNLAEFFALSQESSANFRYTVSWIDCLARGASLGRGHFIRGNHASSQFHQYPSKESKPRTIPIDFPSWALNRLTVKAFNFAYFHRQRKKTAKSIVHYEPFFYPLDGIHHWNRIYGARGFYQYQCVVPYTAGNDVIKEILTAIAKSGLGSFLAVLKTFGNIPSLGLMSFPRPGVTLALDFPNSGREVLHLFERLDDITRACHGAVYPAKDARMSSQSFKAFYPNWQNFAAFIDPMFSSSFWRRVMES